MNIDTLILKLIELSDQGHGTKELIAYVQTDGEPLEVLGVNYDKELDEVSLTVDY